MSQKNFEIFSSLPQQSHNSKKNLDWAPNQIRDYRNDPDGPQNPLGQKVIKRCS